MSAVLFFAFLVIQPARNGRSRPTSGSNWHGYIASDAERLRRGITLQNWDDGGELSPFAYFRTLEIFTTAVIHRSGPVSMLEAAPNPAIGAFPVVTDDGRKMSLAEYKFGIFRRTPSPLSDR